MLKQLSKMPPALAVLVRALVIVVAVIAAFVIALGADHLCHVAMGPTTTGSMRNEYWVVFFFCALLLIECAVFFRKVTERRPEFLFLIIVLTTSVFFSWSLGTWQYSWDDGIHYGLIASEGLHEGTTHFNVADLYVTTFLDPVTIENVNHLKDHSLDASQVREFMLDEYEDREGDQRAIRLFTLTDIEYVPCVLVMRLCDFLDLPFSLMFFLTKLPCALIYSLMTFFGMRRLSSGKMLYAVAALIPTNIFLSANYSYSYWTYSFLLFAIASFVGIVQRSRQPKAYEVILMLMAFFLGCLPRIVYFPLILICLCVPLSKFRHTRNAVLYYLAVLFTCAATAGVFFLPTMPTGAAGLGSGDSRGGGSISPVGQLAFILEDPLRYFGMMADFLLPPFAVEGNGADIEGPAYVVSGLLSPIGIQGWFTNYGYLPRPSIAFSIVIVVLLVFTALTDGSSDEESLRGTHAENRGAPALSRPSGSINWTKKVLPTIVSVVTSVVSALLIITFMYMMFTNVGHDQIRGVQRRYMLPFIYPMLAFVSFKRLTLPGKRIPAWIYNTAILMIMAVVLMGSWWQSYLFALN